MNKPLKQYLLEKYQQMKQSWLDISESKPEALGDYPEIERHLFREIRGVFYMGNEPIPKDLRDVLRDQAKSFMNTQLYQILDDKVTAESMRMGLNESENWDHVLSAKQLYNWNRIMKNIVYKLAKD